MSYQVLARKWRPRFFREMAGQEHVLRALINALDHNRLHHAYLFTGTRGVGKTTIARILAKCLNCEAGVSSEPCGQCSACIEIANGSFVDLIEIDAASHTGVDNMRTITDNAQYTPSKGRYKVYLIDEVHMLTTHSFNALLKTLEEPPEHAKFLLATTDPKKLPATVLSRCLQFNLKNLAPERIVAHLQDILQRESIDYEEPGLWALARAAGGSMRDALSLTDQVIAFGQGKIATDDVSHMLGTIDQQTVYRLAQALIDHDPEAIMDAVAASSEQSPDYTAILDALLQLLHRMTVAQLLPHAVDNSQGDREQVQALASAVSAEELQLFYQMGLMGKRDINLAPDLRTGLEMALLRMLAFRPQGVKEPLPAVQLKQAPMEPNPVKKHEPVATTVPIATEEDLQAPSTETEHLSHSQATDGVSENVAAKPLPADNSQWLTLFPKLPLAGLLKAVAAECVLLATDQGRLQMALDKQQVQIYNERHAEQLQQKLSDYFAKPVKLSIGQREPNDDLQTPAQDRKAKQDARHQLALDSLQQDAVVQYFVQNYQASIVPDSVRSQASEIE